MENQGKIPFIAAILMNINIIVGSGIFAFPQFMAAKSGAWSFLGWPLVALMLLPIIWAVAQAARIFPGEGGFYNYCTQGINETAGFVANWAYLLGYIGTAATITSIIRAKLVQQLGWSYFDQHHFIFYLGFIIILSLLNLVSIEIISRVQSSVTLLKLTPLLLLVCIIFFYWNPHFDYSASSLSTIGGSLPFAIFGYWGFESCCSISHLIKGGSTQASKVILLAFAICVTLYTIFHLGVLHIMGLQNLITHGAGMFPQFMGLSPLITQFLLIGISIAIMLSFINTTYGASLTNIVNINVMAKRGFLVGSRFLAKTTSRGVALYAVIVHAIAFLLLLTFISNTAILAAITNFGVSLAFLLTLIAVVRYNFKHKDYLQLVISCLGFLSLGILFYFIWTTQMGTDDNAVRLLYATPILIGVPIGLVMYKCLKSAKKS